ncbi:MAG: carbohydrate ABC transporter permease [bacterium]|nr:carbohydrate ABC transporter permease [bacterium]
MAATTVEAVNKIERGGGWSRFTQERRPGMLVAKLAAFLLMCFIAFLFLVPLVWMISTSLKTPQDLQNPSFIPNPIAWENYRDAFSFGMWGRWTLNTVIITFFSVVGMVFSTSLVAYSFARLRWPGRAFLFSIVLATMMLPDVVTFIPRFIIFSELPAPRVNFPLFALDGNNASWVNTFLPLIVPDFLAGSAFNIFLMRQFMRGVPMELSEAARIDGASEFRIYWNVVLPLCKPALATIAIFTFQSSWQDFMGPLLYLQSEQNYTLQIGLRTFEFAAGGAPNWSWMMAGSLIVMLPVLIVFVLFQQYFIEGIQISGMGGR